MSLLAAPWNLLASYARWLHLQWPAGVPERLPVVAADGGTRVPGLYVVGDLTGVPLLKFALDSGAKAAARCQRELDDTPGPAGVLDVAIVGGGVAGMAAAVALAGSRLRFTVFESNQRLATLANFPSGKPIFTYPPAMRPQGGLQVSATVKEELIAELEVQLAGRDLPLRLATVTHVERRGQLLAVQVRDGEPILARRVIVAIGRSGNFRRLGVPGEDLPKVVNRLHDPKHHAGQDVVVAGGGDSACEAAAACAEAGARVTLVHRGADLAKAKPENAARVITLAKTGRLRLMLGTRFARITADTVEVVSGGSAERLPNLAVLSLIGREAPLEFFRRSGVPIRGERSLPVYAGLIAFVVAITCLYGWKSLGWGGGWLQPATWLRPIADWAGDPASIAGILLHSASGPSFWVTLAYSAAVVGFGIDRMRRRRTPYVRVQTLTLMGIQVLPLFLIPELLLPWLGAHDLVPQAIRDNLFPGDSWWRAYGFILAWPLMAWNVFTEQPYLWWLVISFIQTFVIIPLIVWRWGKGAYCGWICSCGALAETMGDRHREKMPHGTRWNRLNLVGQVILATAAIILVLHIISWTSPATLSPGWVQSVTMRGYWKHAVDWLLAGALGTGLYFWLSGRVWCRFACPLAAWMHIVARFSRFRIVVDQKKCISCNACTTVCHQGIDIMNFANKGRHMQDPECVRCSACVQTCPTQVLQFGRVDCVGRVVAVDGLYAGGPRQPHPEPR
jgi:thioredoxin reductase/Pyruvate/2-oxoacid:ferredoxin oxidoreductase delta subunit